MDATIVAPLVTSVGIVSVAYLDYRRTREPRKEYKRRHRAELAQLRDQLGKAGDRTTRAQERIDDKARLILRLYQGLEGIQRPFDREELMGLIRDHNTKQW
jgi:hypothetical protein